MREKIEIRNPQTSMGFCDKGLFIIIVNSEVSNLLHLRGGSHEAS